MREVWLKHRDTQERKEIQSSYHLLLSKYALSDCALFSPWEINPWDGVSLYSNWWAGCKCRRDPKESHLLLLSVSCFFPSPVLIIWVLLQLRVGRIGSVGSWERATKYKFLSTCEMTSETGIQSLGFPRSPRLWRCSGGVSELFPEALAPQWCFIRVQSEKSQDVVRSTEGICGHLSHTEWTINKDTFSALKKKKATNFFQVW